MNLTIWNIIGLFGAGAASVALGASIAGFLAYKIKYAGKEMFHKEHKSTAEAFNIDSEFADLDTDDPDAPENQGVIKKGNVEFIKQFALDRILKAGDAAAKVGE